MKVKVEVSPEYQPPYAVIYTDVVTEEVKRAMDFFSSPDGSIIGQKGEKLLVLKPAEIYMVRVEEGESVLYTAKEKLYSRKRLYELAAQLGSGFMQISKSCLVNLKYLDSVESSFGGAMLLKLKNGMADYVSRKYLPDFKKYLGL